MSNSHRPPSRPVFWASALTSCLLLGACATTQGNAAGGASDAERGIALLRDGQAEASLVHLGRAHAAAPDDLDLARALTEAQVRAGRTSTFLDELSRRPSTPVVQYMRGLALFTRAADAAGPAIDAFRAAAEGAPGRAELHHRLGVALLESEQVSEALEPLKQAVTLEPQTARFRLPLAKALAQAGAREEAIAQLNALVRAEPPPSARDVETARKLMDLVADPYGTLPASVRPKIEEALSSLQERDQPQPAIVAFEEVLRDFPDLAVVHALVGLAWLRLDDAGRAIERLTRAAELAPWDGHNRFYLGNVYAARQRKAQAVEEWRRAVALHPLLDEAWIGIGSAAMENGALDEAAEAFRIAAALDQKNPMVFGRLAAAHHLAGRTAEAERALDRALALAPDSADINLSMGLLLVERAATLRGEARAPVAERARTLLQKVLTLQPDNLAASKALEQLTAR